MSTKDHPVDVKSNIDSSHIVISTSNRINQAEWFPEFSAKKWQLHDSEPSQKKRTLLCVSKGDGELLCNSASLVIILERRKHLEIVFLFCSILFLKRHFSSGK
ncbi:hypothetical protein J6590_075658 [Homalodisca vitripennis]|nr:hypothetical protein J6590_075658 [Homalodisca vitripennis]